MLPSVDSNKDIQLLWLGKIAIPPSFKLARKTNYKEFCHNFVSGSISGFMRIIRHKHLMQDVKDLILRHATNIPFLNR